MEHKSTISAVIISKNEEKNINHCLESLLWVDEIIIILDSSTVMLNSVQHLDQKKILKQVQDDKKINVFKRVLNGNFSAQRNFGLTKAKGNWVLFIDTDEIVSNELKAELKEVVRNKKIQGYFVRRKDYFLGRWLKYGETGNISLLRLARKEAGKWVGNVHEEWKIQGNTQNLKNTLYHYPHASIREFLAEVNTYSSIRARELNAQNKKISFLEIILYPKLKFFQNYFLRLGFLDGLPGLVMALMMSFHSFLTRAKLWHLNNKQK